MSRTCTVCSHKSRRKIDNAIALGESNRAIASQFGLARGSVQRHKRHAAATIRRASEKRERTIGENVLRDLENFKQRALKLLGVAEREKNHAACIGYLRELRGILGAFYEVITKEAESDRAVGPHPSPCPFCDAEEYRRQAEQLSIRAMNTALGVNGKTKQLVRARLPGENEEGGQDKEIVPQN